MKTPPIMETFLWLGSHTWIVFVVMGGVFVIVLAIHLIRRPGSSASVSFGSARFAIPTEIRRAGLLGRRGVMLGQYQGRYLRDDGDTHIMLVGPTRQGKGIGIIIPTLLTWQESVLATDPKNGENYQVTRGWRERLGPVHAFTPYQRPHARINVMDTVRVESAREVGDAQLIAQSLVAPEKMARENQTSVHFRELAAHLLTAAILHVLYTSKRKSLAGVWQFLTQTHSNLSACLKEMSTTKHLPKGVHPAIYSLTRAIQNITGDRELSSVWSTAIRPLVLYNDPLIAASTDTSDFGIDELQYGARPMSLYLIAPSPMELERSHPLYRVILDVFMTRLMEHEVRTWKYRLLEVLDEMCWFGYTRAIGLGIAVKAGYGMKDLLVAQDLESFFEVYGTHTAIWGNCRVKVFFAPDNDLTAKRISQNMLGDSTVEQEVQHRGGSVHGGTASTTYQYHGRPLLTPDELMELSPAQEIVRVSGLKPILAEKLDYRDDPALMRRVG